MKKKVFSLMMTLVLAFMGVARADELTVNDGTTTNGYVPVYGFYADAYLKAEYVIPAADLAEMAGAEVNGMTFYATQSSVSWGAANFQVFLTEVGSTSISAFNGPGTIVYEGALSVVDGQMVVTFTTPYQYSGGNLLVGLYNTVEGSYVTSTWYGVTADGASVQGYSYSDLASVTPTQRNFLPKTTFAYAGGGGASNGLPHVLSNGVLVDAIDLGARPGYVNATVSPNWQGPAWMEPAKVQMYNDNNRPYTVSVLDFTPNDSLFLVLDAELPFTLAANAMDTVDLNITVRPTEAVTGTTLERQFVAIYEDTRLAAVWPITAEIYSPECPDIWELALNLHPNQMPITNQPLYESTLTGGHLHNDYNLPFDNIEEGYDAVYKLTIENDSKLEAYVLDNYANGKVALYTEDFYGEGGPMATNNYTGIQLGGGGAAATPFDAQIGEGTLTTGYFPFYTYYNYSIATALYTAAELQEAGVTTAPMTSLSWYATNAPGYAQQGISIWMANVEDVQAPSTSPLASGMTLVYTGAVTPEIGWNEFAFNEGSFVWDGSSNVLILCQRLNGAWNTGVTWQAESISGFNGMSYLYDDYTVYDVTTTTYTMYTSTYRPNIIMKGGGRNRDMASFNFEGGMQGWTSIDADGDGRGWFHSTAHPDYDYTEYGNGDSDGFAVSASFSDGTGLSIDANNYLVSPQKYNMGTGANMSFYYDYGGGILWSDYFEVCVSTANNPTASSFTPIWNSGARSRNGQSGSVRNSMNRNRDWSQVTVDLSAYVGQEVWIAFHHEDFDMYEIWIDDVTINTGSSAPTPPTPPTPTPGLIDLISFGPEIENLPLTPGNYYLVASSTDENFEVYIDVTPMPCPQVEGFVFSPMPADDTDEVEPASVTLQWAIPNYATGWRLIFGTTYHPEVGHPQTIIYPEDGSFSHDMANSYIVRNLWNNTNYFWRVEFNNDQCPDGVSSPIWGFTTHLNVPQQLVANDYAIFDDETVTLSWNAVVDRTYRTYNVYRDGELIGSTQMNNINATTYTDGPLDYNMAGYTYYVTAVYDEGESAPSNTIDVKVSGYSNATGINGYAYEQDGETPIPGVLVTLTGTDEFGDAHTYTATTNNNGYYNKQVYAGEYTNAVATLDGYQETVTTHPLPFTVAYDAQEDNVNFIIDENFDPVCEVFAQYYPDSLDVNSPYVKVYWGCGFLPDAIIEDFETGDFSMFDWQVSANYPWSITTNNPYEGQYCMVSGGAGVNNVVSDMIITMEIPGDGNMSFFGKISSENNWDYGYFYIDGQQMGTYTGAGNWAERTFPITAGEHTFRWSYQKDGSVNSNDDCFYVDYINFYKQPEPAIPGMTYDFDNSTMQGWTSIDADGDGYNWMVGGDVMGTGYGHNGSADLVLSQSYDNSWGALTPDNYLVSPQVQLGGVLRFYACAQDANYAAEHFGVAVSTSGNTNPADFTTIQEWTMSAKSVPAPKKAAVSAFTSAASAKGHSRNGNNRAQGEWYEFNVDLSAYSGMGYVAIRHFNCTDMFYLDVDDITIGEPSKGIAEAPTRSLNHYRVYRTNCYNDGPYTEENTVLLATVWVPDTVYIDVEWADLPAGIYKWGVGAVYAGNRGELTESEINWTEPINVNNGEMGNRAEFTYGFEGGLEGWTVMDAPGSEVSWVHSDNNPGGYDYTVLAHGGTGFALGYSFVDYDGAYQIDSYLVSPQMYSISAGSSISFWADNANDSYPESFSVCVATAANPTIADFTTVWTGAAKGNTGIKSESRHDGNRYENWRSHSVDLSAYAGQQVWIAFHDVNYDAYEAWIDDVVITAGGAPTPGPTPGTGNSNYLALPRESETIWSNCLDKDMWLEGLVTVNVLLNSADNPEGATVKFRNLNEGEQELYPMQTITIDETGYYIFEDGFRKGDYEVTVEKDGYETIVDNVSIWAPTDLRYVMIEIIYGVDNLYVSSTGWAMWDAMGDPTNPDNPQGGDNSFTEGFEGGLNGWNVIDASGSEATWVHSNNNPGGYDYTTLAHGGTGFAMGYSFIDYVGAYSIDSYLVTPQKYSITANSHLTFWADNANDSYPEGFSVCVATVDNPTANDFTTVWSGNAKANGGAKATNRHDENRYENWRSHDVDLSAYAGQNVYIAFHDVNYDMYEIWIDDVELSAGRSEGDRHLEYFKVMCESIDHEPIFNANTVHPFCQVATDELVPGEHYICKVAAVYSTGQSAWSEVEWQYIPCTEYAGTVDGVDVNGNEISWTYPGGNGPVNPTDGSTFSESFENGVPAGWATIDADGDGNNWTRASVLMAGYVITPHSGEDMMCSASWYQSQVLHPDNYLVSEQVTFGSGSTFTFWAAAQDASYPAEHFGVAISTGSQTNPADFTTIQEWTMTAKGEGKATGITRSGRAMGNYYQYTVDLSAYAGQTGYIAVRHFNCSDNFYLDVDDFELTNGAKNRDGEWYYYDNGENSDAIGLSYGTLNFNWGIMFPAGSYTSGNLTKVGYYDYTAHSGIIHIYQGGNSNVTPGTEIYSQAYTVGGTSTYIEIAMTNNVAVDATQDLWVVMESTTPGYTAAIDNSGSTNPNGGLVSTDGASYSPIDVASGGSIVGNWNLRAYIEGGTNPVQPGDGNVLGAMIFADGEWEAFVPYPTNTYVYEGDANELCVRMVYDGTNTLPEGNIYYSMSCEECVEINGACAAGLPIHAESLYESDQVKVWWGNAPAEPIEDWLYYDDGSNVDAIGLQNGGSFYWGIKFPANALNAYVGCSVTKIAYFDYAAHTGTVRIYQGSNGNGPSNNMIGSYSYTANGTEDWVEWNIPAVSFDNTQDLWIVMNNNGGQYVAAMGNYTGDPNGTMISTDGSSWYTLSDATGGQYEYTWNLRCFVSNLAKGNNQVVEMPLPSVNGGELANAGIAKGGNFQGRAVRATRTGYNVYRATTATGDYSFIGWVEEDNSGYYEFIDTPETAGNYFYQVTAVYDNDCESEPAVAFDDPSVNYVSAIVTGISENKGEVALYPNPTSGNVKIEAQGMTHITVVSVLGQVVYDAAVSGNEYELNMGQYNAGVYMVRIATENGVSTQRVTVVK